MWLLNRFKKKNTVKTGTVGAINAVSKKANALRNTSTKDNWEDWVKYRQRIADVLRRVMDIQNTGSKHVLLLGAGNGNDVPINFIESVFDQITIVDIDGQALDRLIARAVHPEKYQKVVMDLTGLGDEIQSPEGLLEVLSTLEPAIDFSLLTGRYDVVINLCFSSQLLSSFFYLENEVELDVTQITELNLLNDRIHTALFDGLRDLLTEHGFILHLTDILELKTNKLTGEVSPATRVAEYIIKGNWNNIAIFHNHITSLITQGLCLWGTLTYNLALSRGYEEFKNTYYLLWEFAHNRVEDRNYVVSAHVLIVKKK